MQKITKPITWCATLAAMLSLIPIESRAFDDGNRGRYDSGSLTELTPNIREWADLSSHHSLDMLGITDMVCNCSFTFGRDEQLWLFNVEPKIEEVEHNGPADGKLKSGDVIVAIDGLLITTRRAGVRFANLVAGEPVVFDVRRRGRSFSVTVVPRAVREPEVPIDLTVHYSDPPNTVTIEPGATALPELARSIEELSRRATGLGKVIGSLGLPVVPEFASFPELNLDFLEKTPMGWIGFGLSFKGSIRQENPDEPAEWRFNDPPAIVSIQPGSPAEEAGLQVNDVLLEIDGEKLNSKKGGKRFSGMEPGEVVEWKVQRGETRFTVETRATQRPRRQRSEAKLERLTPDALPPLRYTGTLGDTDVEVRGGRNVEVQVDEETAEIVIRTGDSVVRLKSRAGR